jgi:hypothetical protein
MKASAGARTKEEEEEEETRTAFKVRLEGPGDRSALAQRASLQKWPKQKEKETTQCP